MFNEKRRYEIMFEFIKKIFVRLLTSIVRASNHTKCMSLSNQTFLTLPTLFNLHPNEYSQELRYYYQLAVNLHRCAGSCNTLDDLYRRVCVPNKTKDLKLHDFNKITGINNQKH